MTPEARKLFEQILLLSQDDQEEIADEVWRSLDNPKDSEPHPEWEAEIKRRLEEFESGKVESVPWEVVRRELWADLEEGRKDPRP